MLKARLLKPEKFKGKTIHFCLMYITGGDRPVKATCGEKTAIGKTKRVRYDLYEREEERYY